MKTIKTYLPIFQGFYNTMYEPDEEQEIYNINQQRVEKNLSEINSEQCIFNYPEYTKDISIAVCNYLETELKDINILTTIKFEAVSSPKEYNFSNDSINIEVELTDENIKNIKRFIYNNLDKYKQYLIDNYTHHSGFISFYSNDFNDWLKITNFFNDYSKKYHYLGSVLEFICQMNEINNDSMFDSITDVNVECTNYEELINE